MHYTVYTIHFIEYSIHYTEYSIHFTVYTIHFTEYSIHYTVYTIQHTVYTIHTMSHIRYSNVRRFLFHTVVQKKRTKVNHVSFNKNHPILVIGDDKGNALTLKLSPNLRKCLKVIMLILNIDYSLVCDVHCTVYTTVCTLTKHRQLYNIHRH